MFAFTDNCIWWFNIKIFIHFIWITNDSWIEILNKIKPEIASNPYLSMSSIGFFVLLHIRLLLDFWSCLPFLVCINFNRNFYNFNLKCIFTTVSLHLVWYVKQLHVLYVYFLSLSFWCILCGPFFCKYLYNRQSTKLLTRWFFFHKSTLSAFSQLRYIFQAQHFARLLILAVWFRHLVFILIQIEKQTLLSFYSICMYMYIVHIIFFCFSKP